MDFARYWQAVFARAWSRTWAAIVKKSPLDIARDILLAGIALGGAYALQGWLVRVGALTTGNNFVAEMALTLSIGLLGLVALFALYFVGEAIFVTPYALWLEAHEAVGTAKEETGFSVRSWDAVNPLALYQVACLWEGLSPPGLPDHGLPPQVFPRLAMLKHAVNRGLLPRAKIPGVPDDTRARLALGVLAVMAGPHVANGETTVDRNALRLYAEARSERPPFLFPEDAVALPASPISLTLEVEPLRGLLYGSGERYYAVLTNNSDKTIENISLRALDSWFTQIAVSEALTGHSDQYRRPLDIPLKIADLHPDAPERIQLMGISHADRGESKDILNTVQRFTFEARGKDTKAVRVTFEYDPKARPMIRAVEA